MNDIIDIRRKIRQEKRFVAQRQRKQPRRKLTQNSDTFGQNPLVFNRGISNDSLDNYLSPGSPARSDNRTADSQTESGGFSPAYLLFERGVSGDSSDILNQSAPKSLFRKETRSNLPPLYPTNHKFKGTLLKIERTEIETSSNSEMKKAGDTEQVDNTEEEMRRIEQEQEEGYSPKLTIMSEEGEKKESEVIEEEIFNGYLDFETYVRLVEQNPSILRWFSIDLHHVEHWAKCLRK